MEKRKELPGAKPTVRIAKYNEPQNTMNRQITRINMSENKLYTGHKIKKLTKIYKRNTI